MLKSSAMNPGFYRKRPRAAGMLRMSAGIGVAATALVFYLKTLAPTVLYYDPDGLYDALMLQVKAYVLGIPNPTGYPTYIMLTHLFTYLPFGDVGYRVNLASAVYGAVAVFLIFAVCLVLTRRVAAAAGAALLFAFSRAFWSQAVIAEVYTMNILFVSLVILVLLVWRETRRDRHLLLAAFLAGLSMTHHMTSGLLIPAGVLFVALVDRRKLFEWRLVLKGTGLFLLALTPYLYLPIRASMDPPLNETDPSTPGRFLDLVTGSQFESRMFAFGLEELPARFEMYLGYLQGQFHPAFLLVAALGALYLSLKDRAALAMLGFLYLGWLVYGLEYDIKDVYVYFIPTYLILCVLAGAGAGVLLEMVDDPESGLRPGARVAAVALLSAAIVLAPLSGIGRSYAAVDRSEDDRGRVIMAAIERNTAQDAVVLHNGGVAWYMRFVEGRRPDLEIRDPFPPGGWTRQSPLWLESALKYLREGRRVYIVFPSGTEVHNEALFREAGYDLRPDESGIFYEVVRRATVRAQSEPVVSSGRRRIS